MGCDLIEKNETAKSNVAIHTSSTPIMIIVNIAPMSSSVPVVLNMPTRVFSASRLSDFL